MQAKKVERQRKAQLLKEQKKSKKRVPKNLLAENNITIVETSGLFTFKIIITTSFIM